MDYEYGTMHGVLMSWSKSIVFGRLGMGNQLFYEKMLGRKNQSWPNMISYIQSKIV
jgi:hypothetical protein